MIQRNQSGFTLMEMLIALAIIGVISVIVSVSVSSFTQQKRLEQGTSDFIATLQLAQSEAFSGYIASGLLTAPEFGYGVHFEYPNSSEYVIFADQANQILEGGKVDYKYDVNTDQIIESHNLPTEVSFVDCVYDGAPIVVAGNSYSCDVVFLTQKESANIRIDDRKEAGTTNTFSLQDADTGEQKNVIIKKWLGIIFQE